MVGLAIDAVGESNGDYVLDVEVPSNRPDCLSHVGIAREVAVIESNALRFPEKKPAPVAGRAEKFTAIDILAADLCPRYAARLVRGVKIGPSPDWLVKRLEEIGQRAINNVADITNYVLHELGQPLHAFDLAKLEEHRIVVRRARPGEKLTTLDGVERTLTSEMLVIADAAEAVALAGIMGGEESEISTSTVDVLIESAYFQPDSVRRTARHLGMDTEASRRFERGADCENVLRAQTRCVELICEIAGGVATENAIDVYPRQVTPARIPFRPARVKALTSVDVSEVEMIRILHALGFAEEGAGQAGEELFVAPTWRVDATREEDLVEEIVRHAGYDKIASELPASRMAGEYQPSELMRRAMRRAFSASGFDEAINFSFMASGSEGAFELIPAFSATNLMSIPGRIDEPFVSLSNPIIEGADRMRPTLLWGLLESVRNNLNHGNRDVRLFEAGRVFANSGAGELPNECEALGLIVTGGTTEEGRAGADRELDVLDLKGALETAVDAMKLLPLKFSKGTVKHLRSGQSAWITLSDGQSVGSIGRLAEPISAAYKFRQPVFVAELDLTRLLSSPERAVQYRPLPRYPSVIRDVTLLLDREVTLEEIFNVIRRLKLADYRGAKFVGTYEGQNIPDGKRSVSLRVEYRADDRTLRDEEVEDRQRTLVSSLVQELAAEQH